jgi:hypothetical protein
MRLLHHDVSNMKKCGEERPTCANCVRVGHAVLCEYPAAALGAVSHGSPSARVSNGMRVSPSVGSTGADGFHFEWDAVSLELMHSYCTITCFSFATDPALQSFYQLDIPKVGFAHLHVLHLILAISAMHLSRFRPTRRIFYLEQAEKHAQAGFRIASRLLPNINQDNCHSLFLFASLSCSYTLVKGPRPGSFLLFDDDGRAEWMSLFRGIKTVLELHGDDIQNGILSPMIRARISVAHQGHHSLPSRESDQLDRLRVLIENTSSSREDCQALNAAVDNLHPLFASRIGGDGRTVNLQLESIGVWMYRCTDQFTTLLQSRQPAALAIFAHACLPLNDLGSHWVMAGWISHLLVGIWERLPREYHPWIQWPIQQIGWIPPEQ